MYQALLGGCEWFCSLAVELQRLTWGKCCYVSDEVVFRVCPWTWGYWALG